MPALRDLLPPARLAAVPLLEQPCPALGVETPGELLSERGQVVRRLLLILQLHGRADMVRMRSVLLSIVPSSSHACERPRPLGHRRAISRPAGYVDFPPLGPHTSRQ